MFGKTLIRRAVATAVAAGSGFVAIVALGATIFYALALVVPPLAAAAITALLFAVVALVVAMVFLRAAEGDDADEDEEPEGLAARAYHLFRQRPILGTVAGLAGGWIFLRNPALATMVAAAFTEKSHIRRRR
jgi:membrane protein implicated in regulation of membrane protease activity